MLEPSERVCTKDDVYVLELLIRSASNLGGYCGGKIITDFLVPIHKGHVPQFPELLLLWFDCMSAAEKFLFHHNTRTLKLEAVQDAPRYHYRLFTVLLQEQPLNFQVQIIYSKTHFYTSPVPPPGLFTIYDLYASLSYTNMLSFYSRTSNTIEEFLNELAEKHLTIDEHILAALSEGEFYDSRIKSIKAMIAEGYKVFYPGSKTEVSSDISVADVKKYVQDNGLENSERLVYSVKRDTMKFDKNPFEIFIETQIATASQFSVRRELLEIRSELSCLIDRIDKALTIIKS